MAHLSVRHSFVLRCKRTQDYLLNALFKFVFVNRIADLIEIAFQFFLVVFSELAVIRFVFHFLLFARHIRQVAAHSIGFFLCKLLTLLPFINVFHQLSLSGFNRPDF